MVQFSTLMDIYFTFLFFFFMTVFSLIFYFCKKYVGEKDTAIVNQEKEIKNLLNVFCSENAPNCDLKTEVHTELWFLCTVVYPQSNMSPDVSHSLPVYLPLLVSPIPTAYSTEMLELLTLSMLHVGVVSYWIVKPKVCIPKSHCVLTSCNTLELVPLCLGHLNKIWKSMSIDTTVYW